jgi:hypothetical protein
MAVALDKCALSNKMVNILLLQVSPGYEEDTLKEIKNKFGQETRVYLGLGRYDLIAIREELDFRFLEKFYKHGLSHVVDWFPIVGLRWADAEGKTTQFLDNDKIIGICCIKLDLDYALTHGENPIEAEERIVAAIRSRVSCMACCSLGFNEILVVIQSKTFKLLARELIEMKKSLIEKKTPLALDISTIPAVEIGSFLNPISRNELKEILHVYLFLSLKVGLNTSFKKKLEHIVGKPCFSIFGFHDVFLELSGPVGRILEQIMAIRKEGENNGLYSSFSILEHIDEALDFVVSKSRTHAAKIGATSSNEKNRLQSIHEEDEQIRFYERWFQISNRDPMMKHVFKDHSEFFQAAQRLQKRLSEEPDTEIGRHMIRAQVLDTLRESVRVGFEERCCGISQGNLLGPKSIWTEYYGSIQRATMAIESLPMFLFDKLGLGRWPGFCIHGYSSRFYRVEGGIINIPQQFRIYPEMWWGVLHEIGHEIFLRIEDDLKYKLMEELDSMMGSLTEKDERITPVQEKILRTDYVKFIEEIFAELFGFHFGFNDDWKLYINKVWSYFAEQLELDYPHISRSVLAYFTFGPGKDLTNDQVTFEEVDKCIDQLQKITKKEKKAISDDERDSSMAIVFAFLRIADVIRENFLGKPVAYDCGRLREIEDILKKGQIIDSGNPLEILFSTVATGKNHTYRQRFATILSLYGCYCRYLKGSSKENGE